MVTRSSFPASALLGATLIALAAMPILGLSTRGDAGLLPDVPSELAEPAIATEQEEGIRVMAFAQRTATDEVLLNEYSEQPVNPGAVGDLVIGAGVLMALTPNFRFHTNYWAAGRVQRGVLLGDLVVQGFGDPTVDDVRLKWIAHNLQLNGLQRISGRIRLDDGYFRTGVGDEQPDQDADEDLEDSEGAAVATDARDRAPRALQGPVEEHISALSYHHNRARVLVTPTRIGSRASVLIEPPVDHVAVYPFVETTAFGGRLRTVTSSSHEGTTVLLSGAVRSRQAPIAIEIEVGSQSHYFAAALYRHLRKEGIKVRRSFTTEPSDARRRWLIGDQSPPLVELLSAVFHGDTLSRGEHISEALIRTVAVQASGESGGLRLGLETLASRMVDDLHLAEPFRLGTPKDRQSSLSPRQLVTVLRHAHNDFKISSDFLRAIGPATTHRVLDRLPEHQRRRLRGVADLRNGQLSLAGILDTPDGPVSVAVVARGADASIDDLWSAIEQRLDALSPSAAATMSRLLMD